MTAPDGNGNGFVYTLSFALAQGSDLAVADNLTTNGHLAGFDGKLVKAKVQAVTNGAAGGFTLRVNKNGSSIFGTNPSVAANDTAVKNFTPTTTIMAEGDVFTVDCTSAGTGVQYVLVALYALTKST